jgi:GTPase SAR1 family protein
MGVTQGAEKIVLLGRPASGKTTLLQAAVELANARGINCRVCYEDDGQDFETQAGTPVRVAIRCSQNAFACRADEVVVVCVKNDADAASFAQLCFRCLERVCWYNDDSLEAWRAKASNLLPFV